MVLVSHCGILSTRPSSVLLVMLAHDIRCLWPNLHSRVAILLRLVALRWLLLQYLLMGRLVSWKGPVGLILVEYGGLRWPGKKLRRLALVVAWVDGAVVESSLLGVELDLHVGGLVVRLLVAATLPEAVNSLAPLMLLAGELVVHVMLLCLLVEARGRQQRLHLQEMTRSFKVIHLGSWLRLLSRTTLLLEGEQVLIESSSNRLHLLDDKVVHERDLWRLSKLLPLHCCSMLTLEALLDQRLLLGQLGKRAVARRWLLLHLLAVLFSSRASPQ